MLALDATALLVAAHVTGQQSSQTSDDRRIGYGRLVTELETALRGRNQARFCSDARFAEHARRGRRGLQSWYLASSVSWAASVRIIYRYEHSELLVLVLEIAQRQGDYRQP